MPGYTFFITNDERVCTRSSPRKEPFTISARSFCVGNYEKEKDVHFQMLQDTSFSMVTPPEGNVKFNIVAIQNWVNGFGGGNEAWQKKEILGGRGGTTILTFQGKIADNLYSSGNILRLNSSYTYDFVRKMIPHERTGLPDELIEKICEYLANVTLELSVHKYENQLYISNPCFSIEKKYLRQLLM